jgi:hypothetical protein
MKFPKSLKLEACTDTPTNIRGSRYRFDCIRVSKDRAAVSTRSTLAIVPVETEDGDKPEGQLVPLDAYKLARKVAGAKAQPSVKVNGVAEAGGITFPMGEGEFPKYQHIIPSVAAETHVEIALDADSLRDVLDAVAALNESYRGPLRCIRLVVPKDSMSPIVVVSESESGGVGILMPCTPSEMKVSDRLDWARA